MAYPQELQSILVKNIKEDYLDFILLNQEKGIFKYLILKKIIKDKDNFVAEIYNYFNDYGEAPLITRKIAEDLYEKLTVYKFIMIMSDYEDASEEDEEPVNIPKLINNIYVVFGGATRQRLLEINGFQTEKPNPKKDKVKSFSKSKSTVEEEKHYNWYLDRGVGFKLEQSGTRYRNGKSSVPEKLELVISLRPNMMTIPGRKQFIKDFESMLGIRLNLGDLNDE